MRLLPIFPAHLGLIHISRFPNALLRVAAVPIICILCINYVYLTEHRMDKDSPNPSFGV